MDHRDVEQVVKAVAREYGFISWRTMFRQSDRFVDKPERTIRKEATAMCSAILAKMPTMTQRSAAEMLGHSDSFVKSALSQEKYKYVENNADFYGRYIRILNELRAESKKSER